MTDHQFPCLARLDHVGVNVADLAAATAWYTRALGLHVVREFTVEHVGLSGVILQSAHPDHPRGYRIELLSRAGSVPGPRPESPMAAVLTGGYGHFALTVEELDPVYTSLTGHGAAEIMKPGPSPQPGVRMAWVADPEGNLIELIETGPGAGHP